MLAWREGCLLTVEATLPGRLGAMEEVVEGGGGVSGLGVGVESTRIVRGWTARFAASLGVPALGLAAAEADVSFAGVDGVPGRLEESAVGGADSLETSATLFAADMSSLPG